MLTAWIAANVYARMSMDIRVHVLQSTSTQQNKQERLVVNPHRGWTTPQNQLLQCFEFHDKHGRNRRKERICFDHELVRDQNKCVLYGVRPCVMKFKHWSDFA